MEMMRRNKNSDNLRIRNFAGLVCTLAILMPAAAVSAPWDYGVTVDLGVIHTDNVFLASDGQEETEVVYTIVPEFFLTKDDARLTANLRYRPEAYFYSDFSDADDVFHVLDASLTSALVRDRFFVYLGAVNYQSIITPDGRFPTSNLPISRNRVDSRILTARPYWQQRLGQANLLLEAAVGNIDGCGTDSRFERWVGLHRRSNVIREDKTAFQIVVKNPVERPIGR